MLKIYPLTEQQKGLWLEYELEPENCRYNSYVHYEILGPLDEKKFFQTLYSLAETFELFRTRFVEKDNNVYQQISENKLSEIIEYVDLSRFKITKEKAAQLLKEKSLSPYNLKKGIPTRIHLIKTSAKRFYLSIDVHHIVADAFSASLFCQFISEHYNASEDYCDSKIRKGVYDYLTLLSTNDEYSEKSKKKNLSYWQDKLSDENYQFDFKGHVQNQPTPRTNEEAFELEEEIFSKIKRFCKQHKTTPFLFLTGVFSALLYRYWNQKQIMIGYPTNIRPNGYQNSLGFYITTFPFCIKISEQENFIEHIQRLTNQRREDKKHENITLPEISKLIFRTDTSTETYFNILIISTPFNIDIHLNNIKVNNLSVYGGTPRHDLMLLSDFSSSSLPCRLRYNTSIFEKSFIRQFINHIKNLVSESLVSPFQRLSELNFVATEEEKQLLLTWNDTAKDFPREKTIHQLFEEQVQETPHNVAVVYEDESLTYKALNEKANQFAHLLRVQGVGPDTLVAIAMSRSLEMVIGLLGILKAGGAYVPLDPDYPPDRLQFMLEDTNAPLLITQSFLKEKLDSFLNSYAGITLFLDQTLKDDTSPPFFYKDEEDKLIAGNVLSRTKRPHFQEDLARTLPFSSYPKENLIPLATPLNLAYTIYTSGSTGKPKGVCICHRSLHNVIVYFKKQHKIQTALALTSFTFDISGLEIYLPLFQGAKIFIANLETTKDSNLLIKFINKVHPNLIQATPSGWNMIANSQLCSLPPLNMLCGGENLPKALAQDLLAISPCVWNVYGPTETTIWSTQASLPSFSSSVPIGKPISNTEIYILDEEMQPVPIGVRGEIYIGGEGLARGYLNRPELTAERFIPNPFRGKYMNLEESSSSNKESSLTSLRLYKTGDLARYLSDGNIEFLGRSDDQVKIRGFRIECGEIEAALSAHGEVASSLVIPREDEQGHKRLIAYVIPKDMSSFKKESVLTSSTGDSFKRLIDARENNSFTEQIRNHLSTSLPDYMIPAFFVLVDRFPLTPNGKVDKASLPDPDLSLREESFIAPRTKLEEELSHIWSDVLGISLISIHDNFFRIGGHSLLATQVISRIRQIFSRDIPIRTIFDAPTIKDLALHISQTQTSELPPIVPMERPESIPLSFAQERLWFLDQFLPNSPLYNIPVALKLKGHLHIESLEMAFNSLISRHESLRTIFKAENGIAAQVILPPFSLSLSPVDYSNAEDPQAKVMAVAQEEAITPFVLSQGSLFRVHLLRLAEEEHVLLFTSHHIIFDGWSFEIFFKELSTLYCLALEKQELILPPLPLQYADFTLWQRQWLQGNVLDQQLSYWKQQLAGIPDLLELPADKPRPKELSYAGGVHITSFSKELQEQLHTLAQEHQASLFMTLLAIFQVLLTRYTGQKDIVVGSPIAGRQYKEIEGLLGFFVNTLALRTTFQRHETFSDVLKKVKETTLQAYQHQDVPFEQLVDHLKIERVTNRNPLFQVELSVESTTKLPPSFLNGIEVKQIQSNTSWSRFDLRVLILDSQDGLAVYLEYAKDLFYEETIKKIATHFELLIKDILKDPNKKISEYSFLTPQEEEQLLITWNDTATSYPREKIIHQFFEEQVQETPHNIAVVYEDESLTYKVLNEKANQLAHLLRAQGVGPDTLVAIAMDRSLEMIIGLLGILKAGGAYVPLDPSYPPDRLQFMLEDTNAPFIITDTKNKDKLPSTWAQLICLDDQNTQINQYSSTNPAPLATSLNLAYTIYTSGSTGKSKGVEIEHKKVVNYIYYNLSLYASSSFGTTLLHSSIVFDMSITSIFFPLSRGDTLSLLQREHKIDDLLLSLKKNQDITFIKLTPSHLQTLKEDLLNLLSPQRRFIIGGENLLQEDIMPYLRKDLSSNNLIINEYGPTEATVGCSVFAITSSASLPSFSSSVPIGKPISNTEIYILDEEMQPVPIGVRGEIYIGGEGLARGYLNRPELTAERFIPNPFRGKYMNLEESSSSNKESSLTSLRLYKTGDLARYLSDGNIEFLGRSDDQVKIRGFRIECGEIEAALSAHGEVASSLVIPREDEQGHKRLIAYVIPKDMSSFKKESVLTSSTGDSFKRLIDARENNSFTEQIRNHLSTSLPDYMIPAFFVLVDRFPLTPNGKVDKASLPDPDLSLREESFIAPRTKLEEELSHIWSDVLGISLISIHDNFFRIGGHSLLATQVISRIRQIFSRDIPIRTIFDAPTIKDLALHISQTQTSELPPIVPMERPESIPLSFAQERLWFLDQFLPNSPLYNIPVALKLKGHLHIESLEMAFNSLISRHESLRTIFKAENGIAAQVILPPFSLSLSPVDYSNAEDPQAKVMAVAQEEAITPFVLSQGSLFRVHLLRLAEEEHVLLFTSHHIIFDGWSFEIFFKELSTLYCLALEKQELILPPLPLQYADFTLWQRQWLQGNVLDQQLSYWKQQLAGIPDLLELPADKPRPKELSYAGGVHITSFSKELQEQLHTLAQEHQASLFMTLLAIFQVLLTRYTGQKDIVVGSPIAGRQYKEIEGLLGFFVNTLALRTTFQRHETFSDVLKKVKETTLQAYQHQDVPFEQLVDHLKIERVTNRNPLFQVMFVLHNATSDETLSDLQVFRLPLEHSISKFDLTLNALEYQEGISLAFEYSTDLFEEETIKRMTNHLEKLIKQCVKNSSQSFQEIPFLQEEEKQQILLTWNDTKVDYPADKTIYQLFEEQVEKSP
ncbi:MAG: amino acid adenylation domain-containing protein, partial [Alphaproteobacteria bacterium]|nr:amino acid adenylation domain-containing protein [Alphaproteobacteria bacterium]